MFWRVFSVFKTHTCIYLLRGKTDDVLLWLDLGVRCILHILKNWSLPVHLSEPEIGLLASSYSQNQLPHNGLKH